MQMTLRAGAAAFLQKEADLFMARYAGRLSDCSAGPHLE
jgi:hypothetical protein